MTLSAQTSSEECVLIYDGLNPVKRSGPIITSIYRDVQEDPAEVRLEQIDKLNSIGIENYVKLALTGAERDYITISGNKFNLLDVAIIKGAKEQTISQLFQLGYFVSPQVIPIIYNSSNYLKTIEIINTMTIGRLENILIEYRKSAYSITNFLIMKNEFEALNYLEKIIILILNPTLRWGTC
tara:strand:+ start:260 stop:805 length:546 start_codon:yes stop_codon:yes gene_type:complete